MSDPYQVVLTNPTSIAARRALAAHWRSTGDPRAELIERQLRDHDGLPVNGGWKILNEINRIIRRHGREWAGRIAELTKGYEYELGCVAGMGLSGESFVQHGAELVGLAPIVHLRLGPPIDVKQLAVTPALGQMRTLVIIGGPWLDDEFAYTLAASPYIRRLRTLTLCGGQLGEEGLRAIAGTANLPEKIYIEVTGNPGVNESRSPAENFDGRYFIVGYHAGPYLEKAYTAAALGYDPMRLDRWPPVGYDITYTE